MLPKLLALIMGTPAPATQPRRLSVNQRASRERELIRRESKIGAEVFGPVEAGHQREFFCLDTHTWVWHEQWTDPATNMPGALYVKYELQPRGVLKTVNGIVKGYVGDTELTRLLNAIDLYHTRVTTEVYGRTLASVPA